MWQLEIFNKSIKKKIKFKKLIEILSPMDEKMFRC